jgi:pimeloyl-ACP methyl ester carboxylesterase
MIKQRKKRSRSYLKLKIHQLDIILTLVFLVAHAADVVRLLENLKVKNVSFIGHAMGGRVGMYTALHR